MKENMENKITLEDIAQHVGYSASHFSALFSERTSYAPMEYYNQLKIQRACSFLQFSDLKIKVHKFVVVVQVHLLSANPFDKALLS